MLQYSVQGLCKIEDGALFDKKAGNSCKLLLIAVTESFVLIVAEPLEPTLKHIDKIRLRK